MAISISKEMNDKLASQIIDDEFNTVEGNNDSDNDEFEEFMDLFNSERQRKDYDWMSDIRIPEFASHMLTQSSLDVDQYFSTRDFVEVYIEDEGDEAKANAEASKELINRTLNQRGLYHYSKYVRGKSLSNMAGKVYALCNWEQKLERRQVGTEPRIEELDVDELGDPIIDLDFQVPAVRVTQEPVYADVPVVDRFNYEILDQRNVFTDNKYAYTLQEKDFVIIRSETSLEKLEADKERMGYINLDMVGKVEPDSETETSQDSYNKEDQDQKPQNPVEKKYDLLQRFGKYWCKVTERDENTNQPLEVEPGIDKDGNFMEGAELLETIITFVKNGSTRVAIRFQLTPYVDAEGNPYRPILRGLCYIHPSEDGGVGDGKYSKELQIAIDDSFNIGQDRVMMATMPTMKGKRDSIENNATVRFEPNHVIELENVDDLTEFKLSDNIQGTLNQINTLSNSMDKVTSIFPSTMGQLPGFASTTATAVAGAEQRTNIRTNYKSLTFENTFLSELYWMIQQMTFTFAKPETGQKLMGDKVFNFDPSKNYYYKPVSASIETEQSKQMKVGKWQQMLSSVIQIQHPDAVKMANHIMTQIAALLGDEYVNFADNLLNPEQPIDQSGAGSQEAVQGQVASNQFGIPQSTGETQTREVANGAQ